MDMGQAGRSQIVEYVTGNVVPSDVTLALGYSRVFRKRALRTLENLDEEELTEGGISSAPARKLIKEKNRAKSLIEKGDLEGIKDFKGIGKKSFKRLLQLITRLNSEYTDGKVTVDKKRILRVPSSLHSTVSRKCVDISDIDQFSLDDAVPDFLEEES